MSNFLILLVSTLTIVWSVLLIVLFFKIWGMTNDISKIEQRLAQVFPTKNEVKHEEIQQAYDNKKIPVGEFSVGMKVIYPPMNRIMFIKRFLDDGKIECVSYKKDGREEFEGNYEPSQIKQFD